MAAAACVCALLAVLLLAVPPVAGWAHPRVSREALLATLPHCRGGDRVYWEHPASWEEPPPADADLPPCELRYVRARDVPPSVWRMRFDPDEGAWMIASPDRVDVVLDDPAVIGTGTRGSTTTHELVHMDLPLPPQTAAAALAWFELGPFSAHALTFPVWWPTFLSGAWRVPVGIVLAGLALGMGLLRRRVDA
ncbi:MAG TPA: hypothetical protein VF112_03220 [Candidatus Dormibacteraeota bacterium]